MAYRKSAIERLVVDKVMTDPKFREELLREPKASLSKLLEAEMPASLKVIVHEDDPQTMHIVVPSMRTTAVELDDSELGSLAGGWWGWGPFSDRGYSSG